MTALPHQELVNRLEKMARHYAKWARRQDIHCYRIYDRDHPSYPFALDRYEDRYHVQVYERPHETDDEVADMDAAVLEAACAALEVPPAAVFLKRRRRLVQGSQYEKLEADWDEEVVVREGGLAFRVRLASYLDTGLFLDHRITRGIVRAASADKHFLNLFAYTGSFTVYAAAGGATRTTSVDLSATYLAWAGRNLAENGLADASRHELIQADVLPWLADARREGRRYDVIVCDPPTFSRSKRAEHDFDVQRDHPELVRGCLALLRPGGELYFSTNARRFRLADAAELGAREVADFTARTTSEDFRRHPLHAAWRIR